ncbi:hypothetical protein SNOG_05755 [Parastagonospora nodorum SN15]|uniref:Uncharacterized protein n=1 Tax=Phaeosphaeria nodorum (strain SN15 / ATCC MYA-4574 / FGSC 10173) TaxID=321614 RepID=Q0UR59_PHANO|nr:hypothetical protein SNOG_05755 [Parastagonospora nodorum SN15]EAT86819.1 hypothetical protein SNOG_05755 [Parastagonospora nodorum SN15]
MSCKELCMHFKAQCRVLEHLSALILHGVGVQGWPPPTQEGTTVEIRSHTLTSPLPVLSAATRSVAPNIDALPWSPRTLALAAFTASGFAAGSPDDARATPSSRTHLKGHRTMSTEIEAETDVNPPIQRAADFTRKPDKKEPIDSNIVWDTRH